MQVTDEERVRLMVEDREQYFAKQKEEIAEKRKQKEDRFLTKDLRKAEAEVVRAKDLDAARKRRDERIKKRIAERERKAKAIKEAQTLLVEDVAFEEFVGQVRKEPMFSVVHKPAGKEDANDKTNFSLVPVDAQGKYVDPAVAFDGRVERVKSASADAKGVLISDLVEYYLLGNGYLKPETLEKCLSEAKRLAEARIGALEARKALINKAQTLLVEEGAFKKFMEQVKNHGNVSLIHKYANGKTTLALRPAYGTTAAGKRVTANHVNDKRDCVDAVKAFHERVKQIESILRADSPNAQSYIGAFVDHFLLDNSYLGLESLEKCLECSSFDSPRSNGSDTSSDISAKTS